MKQQDFTRRVFVQSLAGVAAMAAAGRVPGVSAQEARKLKLWAAVIHKVGAKDWSAMEQQAGMSIAYTTKSARADEAIQKMVVGDGNQLFDALTDNGGGMEDALASQGAIVPLDTSKIPNWKNILPIYNEGGLAAHTLRHEGKIVATPMISNADSMAYDYKALGFHPDSWGVMLDSQFKGRVALQNDFGPTLTTMAIYAKESGKIEIADPSNMKPDEVKAVCQFLIDYKKKGQFRTFGQRRGVDVVVLGTDPGRGSEKDRRQSRHPLRHHEGRAPILEQRAHVVEGWPRARGRRSLLPARQRLPFALVRVAHARGSRVRSADDRGRHLHRRPPGRILGRREGAGARYPQAQEPALCNQGQCLAERVPDTYSGLSGLVGALAGRMIGDQPKRDARA
jgi:hypothetical protein